MKWDSKTLFVDHHFVFYKSWMRMTSKRFSWPNVVTYVMMVSMMVMRQNNDDVDDGDDDGKDVDDERPVLLAEYNDDDDDDEDDVKDGDDERALLLAGHNYLFVRGLLLAALHLSRY